MFSFTAPVNLISANYHPNKHQLGAEMAGIWKCRNSLLPWCYEVKCQRLNGLNANGIRASWSCCIKESHISCCYWPRLTRKLTVTYIVKRMNHLITVKVSLKVRGAELSCLFISLSHTQNNYSVQPVEYYYRAFFRSWFKIVVEMDLFNQTCTSLDKHCNDCSAVKTNDLINAR